MPASWAGAEVGMTVKATAGAALGPDELGVPPLLPLLPAGRLGAVVLCEQAPTRPAIGTATAEAASDRSNARRVDRIRLVRMGFTPPTSNQSRRQPRARRAIA